MASYPTATYTPRTKENRTGVVYDANKTKVVYAEDITKLDDEVVAIENELGVEPKGTDADVTARLDRMQDEIDSAGGGGGASIDVLCAELSADQNIDNNTNTTVTFDSVKVETFDPTTLSSGVFTAPADGIYKIYSLINVPGVADGNTIDLRIMKNGGWGVGTIIYYNTTEGGTGSAYEPIIVQTIAELLADDTIEIVVKQVTGATKALSYARGQTLQIEKIG